MSDASSPDVPNGLPLASREVVERFLEVELRDADALREAVWSYLDRIEREQHRYEFLNSELAEAIADRYLRLLESFDDYSAGERQLIQAGLMYFVDPDDADDDFGSIIGFDDDRDVLNAILEHLDRHDATIDS